MQKRRPVVTQFPRSFHASFHSTFHHTIHRAISVQVVTTAPMIAIHDKGRTQTIQQQKHSFSEYLYLEWFILE